MRVAYDDVVGTGWWAPGVTDVRPNMLQVSRLRPGGTLGRLSWRKVHGARFGPYWVGLEPQTTISWRVEWAGCNTLCRAGFPLLPEQAVDVIRRFKDTLRRKRGTLLVQLRSTDSVGSRFSRYPTGGPFYFVSVCHTTQVGAELPNDFLPPGFPRHLR